MLDISVAGVTDFVKDPLYQGEVTFGLDPRVPLQSRIKGCQLFSSEGLKSVIPLNRVHYYQLTLCLAGRTTATLSLSNYELHRNMVYFSFPGQTNQFPRLDPELRTLSIAFTQDFYLTGEQPLMMLYKYPFLQYDGVPAFELTEAQAMAVAAELHRLNEVYTSDYPLREEVLRLGISQMLHTANHRYGQLRFENQHEFATAGTVLTNRFIYLICQHHLHQRRIADYADMLAVIPNHLNETVKHTTGKTCSELIKTMMVLEAKIMLRQTDRSVSEIANELNFQDLSHFTKYFKKYTQLTPVEFRRLT